MAEDLPPTHPHNIAEWVAGLDLSEPKIEPLKYDDMDYSFSRAMAHNRGEKMDPNEEVKTAPEGVETGDTPSTPDPVREDVASSEVTPAADPDFEVAEDADPGVQVPGSVGQEVGPSDTHTLIGSRSLKRTQAEVDAMMFAGVSLVIMLAKICHEANKAYCQMLGDFSQQPWEAAPEWQQMSAIKGVRMHLQNPDASPSDSHESWLKEKAATGWKYGPEKNPETKEHPCFVPYGELPLDQRKKDYLFKSIVDAFRP